MGKSSPHVFFVWKEIQAPAEPLGGEGARSPPPAAPTIWPSPWKRRGHTLCPGCRPLHVQLPRQPSLQFVFSPSKRRSLEVRLLPLSPPGEGHAPPSLPWFLSTLESLWGRLQQMELGVRLKPHVESPAGGNGLHLLEAIAWRAEVRDPLSGAGRARRSL